MRELKVDKVLISKQIQISENYKEFLKIVKDNNISVLIAKLGDKIKIEKNIYFSILWPDDSNIINENILNNNSIVCKLNYGKISILFTGDIEEIAEKQIIKKYQNNKFILKSTIIKIAHHGSKSSSSEDFLNAVNPKIALIGVGEDNKFGHPNYSVIHRLINNGTKIYRTDKMGEISITINTNGLINTKQFIR